MDAGTGVSVHAYADFHYSFSKAKPNPEQKHRKTKKKKKSENVSCVYMCDASVHRIIWSDHNSCRMRHSELVKKKCDSASEAIAAVFIEI